MTDMNFDCPECGHNLEVDENGAGMTVPCPECSKPIQIPIHNANKQNFHSFFCPQCRHPLEASKEYYGQLIDCPSCGQPVEVPFPNTIQNTPAPLQQKTIPTQTSSCNTPSSRPSQNKAPNSNIDPNSITQSSSTKACPYCGELILEIAVKCKHCGEFLDHSINETNSSQQTIAPDVSKGEIMCPNCKYVGLPDREAKGSTILGILLCLLWVVPGIIYFIIMNGYNYSCPNCGIKIQK